MTKYNSCQYVCDDIYVLDKQSKDEIDNAEQLSNLNKLKNSDKKNVISFNSEVTVGDTKFSANISKNANKLTLQFQGKSVPFPILSKANFNVKIIIPDNEVGCCNDCDVCITPIC